MVLSSLSLQKAYVKTVLPAPALSLFSVITSDTAGNRLTNSGTPESLARADFPVLEFFSLQYPCASRARPASQDIVLFYLEAESR